MMSNQRSASFQLIWGYQHLCYRSPEVCLGSCGVLYLYYTDEWVGLFSVGRPDQERLVEGHPVSRLSMSSPLDSDRVVNPILKKVDRSDPSNYRPIAFTSILWMKSIGKNGYKHSMYLQNNNILSDRQYRFCQNQLCGDLLGYVTHAWGQYLEHGEVQTVDLDISIAFNWVWHSVWEVYHKI